MILNKILNIGVMLVVPSLGFFAACSNDDDVASSFSETNTGKPVEQKGLLAELDTSLVHKKVSGENICVDSVDDELYEGPMLLRKNNPEDSVIAWGRVMCRPHKDIYLFMDARAQVVDAKGNPMAFAKVYEGVCDYDDPKCQYTTDKDGYFYMDSVNYLTYWENDFAKEAKYAYIEDFRNLQLRALSADSILGANVYSSFLNASVVAIDGKLVAELEKIVVETVYSAKVYLDSLYIAYDENTSERDRENFDNWNKGIKEDLKNGEKVCIEKKGENDESSPSSFYPCQRVTDEDYKNGYMTIYGLPEGTYNILIGGTYYEFSPLEVKP